LLALLRDRPLAHPGTVLHVVMVATQPMLVVWLVDRGLAADPGRWPALLAALRTGQTSLLVFLIASVFALLALVLRRDVFEVALLWCLASGATVVHGGVGTTGAALMLAAAQLTLIMALVEDGYRLAFVDQLTGLPGRRALDELLPTLNGEYALAMVDVDHFKRFNDRHGHEAGDQALRMVAQYLRGVGGGGRAFRYGGEEFVVVFGGAATADAREHLETMRKALAGRTFGIRAVNRPRRKPEGAASGKGPSERARVRVSIGLAGPTARRSTPPEVLRAADRALYRAKRAGRNRLVSV
jgi:diguanylate cyclase (GGDEF)-like protein